MWRCSKKHRVSTAVASRVTHTVGGGTREVEDANNALQQDMSYLGHKTLAFARSY